MITFSKLEKKGHLGNQLFQIASTIGVAVDNQHDFVFLNGVIIGFLKMNCLLYQNKNL